MNSGPTSASHSGGSSQQPLADPANQELAIEMETAKLAEERGMDREAIKAYENARKLNANQRGIAHALAVLYDRSGMTDAAAREYEVAMTETPDSPDVHCDYGYFHYSQGRLVEAETRLRAALKLKSDHHQSQINLGVVVGSLGRYDEAKTLFTQAIGPAAALHNVGMLKLRAGDSVGGRTMIAEAAKLDPSIASGHELLAWLDSQAVQRVATTTQSSKTDPSTGQSEVSGIGMAPVR